MSFDTILWHPTAHRFEEVARSRDVGEVFLVLPPPLALSAIDAMGRGTARVSLVTDLPTVRSLRYGLFRRMQRNQWTLTICHATEELAAGQFRELELEIERAQKFRVDVDLFLTLPAPEMRVADATRVFEFLASNGVRRVSFSHPLLLNELGFESRRSTGPGEFFDAFFDAWLSSSRALVIDDVHRMANRIAAVNGRGDPPRDLVFMDARFTYRGADGPVAELRERPEAAGDGRRRCARSCAYYLVCGGEMFGAKHVFNGTIDSADNPYCTLVAKPAFERALAAAAR